MMKKLLVMLLAAVLLCGAAMAEEPFSFRDGLKWGMSPDEVQAVEGEFDDKYSFGGTDMALIEEGNYEGIDCMLQYMFIDNKFCAFAVGPRYDADSLTQQELEQITAYLTAAYGEPAPAGAVPYLIDKFITNSGVEIVTGWQPTKDVYIALIDTYETTALYYFDPSVDFWAAENGEEPETAPAETETAADEAAEPIDAFTFFSGLYMGMSTAEVEETLGLAFDFLEENSGMTMGLMQDFVVDGVDCEAIAMFHNDCLCIFAIGGFADAEDIAVLKDALIAEFGAPSTDAIPYLVDKFTSNSGVTITAGWRPAPDVYATIIDAYGDEAVYFFDPSIDYWAIMNGEEPETAPAETETAADKAIAPTDAFTFRGLAWGMTPAEVEAVEGDEFDSLSAGSYTMSSGYLTDMRVSKYTAEIAYFFIENKLAGAGVTIDDDIDDLETDANYLAQALTSLYGEAQGAEALPDDLLATLFGGFRPDELYVWLPVDGTCIFLLANDWDEIHIGYFDCTHDWVYHVQSTEPVTIDTTGL